MSVLLALIPSVLDPLAPAPVGCGITQNAFPAHSTICYFFLFSYQHQIRFQNPANRIPRVHKKGGGPNKFNNLQKYAI